MRCLCKLLFLVFLGPSFLDFFSSSFSSDTQDSLFILLCSYAFLALFCSFCLLPFLFPSFLPLLGLYLRIIIVICFKKKSRNPERLNSDAIFQHFYNVYGQKFEMMEATVIWRFLYCFVYHLSECDPSFVPKWDWIPT